MIDPLEALLVIVDALLPGEVLLRAIDAAKGLNENEREKLRRAGAEAVAAAHAAGYAQAKAEAVAVCRQMQQGHTSGVAKMCADAIAALSPTADPRAAVGRGTETKG